MDFRAIKQDPFYNGIIYRVESHLAERDQQAQSEESLTPNDSDVKSALRKALGLLAGKQPRSQPKKPKDRWKEQLAAEIVDLHKDLDPELGITRAEFKIVLLTIEDSLKIQRDHAGHPRGYLDFLKGFIADTKEREAKGELP